MVTEFFGFKEGSWQTFDDKGRRVVVSQIGVGKTQVARIKLPEKDGYKSLVVRFAGKKKEYLRELTASDQTFKVGDEIRPEQVFTPGDKVLVQGKVKGRGFAGVVKRWRFAGGPKTHGQSDRHRAPGSIGQRSDPGRVWPGKKMPGRMGGGVKTIKGLQIFSVSDKEGKILVKGLIPGVKGDFVKISKV